MIIHFRNQGRSSVVGIILVILFTGLLGGPLLHAQVVGHPSSQPPGTPTSPQPPGMTPIRQPPITVSSVPFQAGRVSIAPNRSDNDQAISYRIAALEAGRQDLSAWATLLGCVISMILAANVGLSVWQVRNLTQIQVDKLRTKYDKQFSGFLTHSQENLAAKIADYETNIAELTSAIDNMTPMFDGYITETAATVAKMHREIELALERLRKESEIIRQSIEGS